MNTLSPLLLFLFITKDKMKKHHINTEDLETNKDLFLHMKKLGKHLHLRLFPMPYPASGFWFLELALVSVCAVPRRIWLSCWSILTLSSSSILKFPKSLELLATKRSTRLIKIRSSFRSCDLFLCSYLSRNWVLLWFKHTCNLAHPWSFLRHGINTSQSSQECSFQCTCRWFCVEVWVNHFFWSSLLDHHLQPFHQMYLQKVSRVDVCVWRLLLTNLRDYTSGGGRA